MQSKICKYPILILRVVVTTFLQIFDFSLSIKISFIIMLALKQA